MEKMDMFLKEIDWAKWKATHKLFAVLDCAQLEHENLWRSVAAVDHRARRALFDGTADEGLSSVEPVLLDVMHPAYSGIMPWLLEQEKKQAMVLWFVSSRSLDDLQEHFKTLLVVDLPDADDALLRFYDPSVFAKIMQVMTPEQDALFFTHIDKWWAWNMRRDMRYWFAKSGDVKPAHALTFSEAQMERFSQMDIADFEHDVKAELAKDKANLKHAKNMSDEALGEQVKAHIDKAVAFGFETEDTIRAYVVCVASALGWAFADDGHHGNIVQTLSNKGLDEDSKLEQLQAYCTTI